MNATSPDPVIERPWFTYAKAVVFILPAVIAWGFARDRLMPLAKAICDQAGFEPSHLGHSGWVWPVTFFLADWGATILVAGILGFALMEFVAPRWRRRRRVVLGIGIWVTNLAVLFALSVLLTIVLIVAAGLARTRDSSDRKPAVAADEESQELMAQVQRRVGPEEPGGRRG